MRQFNVLFRWGWTFLVVVTLALAGCDGDNGAAGAVGPVGGTGGTGPAGPPGPGASVTPLESCGVCHSDGSVASAPAAHAKITEPGEVEVGSFAGFLVAPDVDVPGDLIISFSVTADGAPATEAALATVYVADGMGGRRSTSSREDPAVRLTASLEPGSGADGNYSVRLVDGATLFGDTPSRYLVIVEVGANELEIAAVGDYPAPIPLAGLASSEACVGCHGPSGEGNGLFGRFNPINRGGHYSAPISAQACVVCHRPDDPATPDEDEEPSYMQFFRVAHGIHNSHNFPDGEFVTDRGNAYDVTYPTYMTNCSVCHSDDTNVPATGGSALAAANAMPVSGRGCFSCHGSMASWDFTGPPDYTALHVNLPDPETFDCATACHNPDGAAFNKVVVADFHNGHITDRDGVIWNGVDASVAEGAKIDWQITDIAVVDDGANLAISWIASYGGMGVNPCNAIAGPGAPVFHADGAEGANLSMLRNYAQGDDFILGESTSAPGQALNVGVTTANTDCQNGVATTTIPADQDVDATVGRVALQGKPRVPNVDPAPDPASDFVEEFGSLMPVRVPTPTFDWLLDSGDPAPARRDVVDTGQCLTCHVGSLYQHGGNRVDNVDMCILCHNSASNEKSVRVGLGVDAAEAYDGKTGETFEIKTMLHRIHSAGVDGQPPYVIYRGRGIYAFAPDTSGLPNWPGTGPQVVYGSAGDAVINHNFHSADYPRALNACTACHTDPFMVIPDQTQSMATTVEAGSTVWEDQLDDTLQGAATTACITCHADSASKGHAYQNSWTPQVFPEGRQTIIDAP